MRPLNQRLPETLLKKVKDLFNEEMTVEAVYDMLVDDVASQQAAGKSPFTKRLATL